MVSRAISAVRNKAQVWVFEALQQIRERLPFELLGLDSDNGAEFINYQLHRYCEQEQITFTRSTPLRKNDNCFVEQKNYSVVRRFAGYARYDTETELEVLNQLYGLLSPYVNFFLPSQKLQEKIRQGSRVTKRYGAWASGTTAQSWPKAIDYIGYPAWSEKSPPYGKEKVKIWRCLMYEEMSLLEFQQAFGSEEACLKYLFEKRWPEEFQCPHCGHGEYYFLKKRRLYQCRACGYQASVTAGTIFHKTRTP